MGAAATDYSGNAIAASNKNLAETQTKNTEALNKTNTANTQALNQTNEDVTKRNINASTIELGNYQNLVLRAGLIIFGIVLVAFAVWRFVQQPGVARDGVAGGTRTGIWDRHRRAPGHREDGKSTWPARRRKRPIRDPAARERLRVEAVIDSRRLRHVEDKLRKLSRSTSTSTRHARHSKSESAPKTQPWSCPNRRADDCAAFNMWWRGCGRIARETFGTI